jgi:hypothetical protein
MQVMHAPFFQLVEVNYYKGNSEPNTHVIKKYETLHDFKITAFLCLCFLWTPSMLPKAMNVGLVFVNET